MSKVTLGGERLGAGNRQKIWLHNYERSTHDLSKILRTTASSGTLIPFMSLVGLPGDSFDINLDCDVMTLPTVGPLFGSWKVQLDCFVAPIRLYNANLHMNQLGIGMKMSDIKLPKVSMVAKVLDKTKDLDSQQINPSSIFSYLGLRGVGSPNGVGVVRKFNAVPYLAYWDIYKNYYANKQEEVGAVIHKNVTVPGATIASARIQGGTPSNYVVTVGDVVPPAKYDSVTFNQQSVMTIVLNDADEANPVDPQLITLDIKDRTGAALKVRLTDLFQVIDVDYSKDEIYGRNYVYSPLGTAIQIGQINQLEADPVAVPRNTPPGITYFPLKNIDDMRLKILRNATPELNISWQDAAPYGLPLSYGGDSSNATFVQAMEFSQEGLGLKTYNSDLFNNWINTDWIDGADGITDITSIDTSKGYVTIDELNLSKKVYDLLNRIAVSGGSYDDWLDAVYTEERTRSSENPMYVGGLIQNLVFQEVTSTVQASADKPLGTLAGKGRLGDKHRGGKIDIKIQEPSYIIGIFSLTPIIDYSQGNRWDLNLDNLDDLHKPALDAIGFQELITEQMAWFETTIDSTTGAVSTWSAGKVPAWINYMTDYNEVKGNFADVNNSMFMTLNRRYTTAWNAQIPEIADITTYIDPSKYNYIFANTEIDAQNFWVQIGMNITARRKMSAKVIPNL